MANKKIRPEERDLQAGSNVRQQYNMGYVSMLTVPTSVQRDGYGS